MDNKLIDYLEKHKIKFREHKHKAVFTVEESKDLKKDIPGLHTKSLFLKDENTHFYLVCMPAQSRLNIKSLRKVLGTDKLHFSSPQELKAELNITPGSVSIFCSIYANPERVTLIIDKKVHEAEISCFHPNINTSTLEITKENLEKFVKSLKIEKKILDLETE